METSRRGVGTMTDLNSAAKACADSVLAIWENDRISDGGMIREVHDVIHRHFTAWSEQWEKRVKELEAGRDSMGFPLSKQVFPKGKPMRPLSSGETWSLLANQVVGAEVFPWDVMPEDPRAKEVIKQLSDMLVALRTERDQLTANADRDYVELSGEVRRLEHVRNHLIQQVESLRVVERERDQLAGQLTRATELVAEIERHCPCGARPESLDTHPHVSGCPVASLRAQLAKGGGE